jgi:hypothetical protein
MPLEVRVEAPGVGQVVVPAVEAKAFKGVAVRRAVHLREVTTRDATVGEMAATIERTSTELLNRTK